MCGVQSQAERVSAAKCVCADKSGVADHFRRGNGNALYLDVNRENTGAWEFYERHGVRTEYFSQGV